MIRIGTDCSGIEAPIEALKQLGIPFQHKWACEKDKFARQSILANYQPEILYQDIIERDHTKLPDVDVYVCGFPCQSFSLMGKKLGTKDPRSNIMLHCIDVIKTKRPSVFILENVKNFKFIEKGKPFKYLIKQLEGILDVEGKNVYSIYYDIYNTKDYGIPQNRQRIYIIGINTGIKTRDFIKPQPLPMIPLHTIAINTDVCDRNNVKDKIIIDKLKSITLDTIITPFKFCTLSKDVCPTLTTSCYRFFWTKYNRNINVKECLLLQGFSTDFCQVVSKTQLCKQIGNSMSVNVLKVILKAIFSNTIYENLL